MRESLKELMLEETYWTTQIQLDIFRQINDYLKENKMTRKAFAEKLGVSKGYVSHILNGEFDHKLSKLVTLLLAVDKVPIIAFKEVEEVLQEAIEPSKAVQFVYKAQKPNANKLQSQLKTARCELNIGNKNSPLTSAA